jgi:hypothetical protein
MPSIDDYRGIIPAIACPFTADHRIDEAALRELASWLAGHQGVVAVMTNGHTGEVFSLTPSERAKVTRIVADELRGRLPVISSIVCEGLADAAEHARAAREAGAVALDVMPPHHWLRFGLTPGHALKYFDAIHQAAPGLDLVCHVYPAWTRASYSSQLLADLARLPYVQAFKVGCAAWASTRGYPRTARRMRARLSSRRLPARVHGQASTALVGLLFHSQPSSTCAGAVKAGIEGRDGGTGDDYAAQGRGPAAAAYREARQDEGRRWCFRRAEWPRPPAHRAAGRPGDGTTARGGRAGAPVSTTVNNTYKPETCNDTLRRSRPSVRGARRDERVGQAPQPVSARDIHSARRQPILRTAGAGFRAMGAVVVENRPGGNGIIGATPSRSTGGRIHALFNASTSLPRQ